MFIFIKIINYQLNRLFDKNKIIEISSSHVDDKIDKKRKSRKLSKSRRRRKTPPSPFSFEVIDDKVKEEDNVVEINVDKEENIELKTTDINFNEITKSKKKV